MMMFLLAVMVMAQVTGNGAAVPPADAPKAGAAAPLMPSEFTGPDAESMRCRRDTLNAAVNTEQLKKWHLLLASEPHVAGTPGDEREVQRLVDGFAGMGLSPEKADLWPLLCAPEHAELSIIAPEHVAIDLAERPLKEDAASAGQGFGWNAYSGSGDVTAGVVYANYGTKADFEKLAAMKVETRGKIVLARYGGNFRGYKARFAEAAGAAGLIIFTDPGDSGYVKGLTYPEGGYANDCCIQRGSILTLPWTGDPLTPGTFASEDAERLKMEDVDLPHIPVQPVSYAAAREIMSRMTGAAVAEGWQGGLPFTYRVEGGEALKVRLAVMQTRTVVKASNVIARIEGSLDPDQMVIVGCHHDAWNCGAADPLAGTIVLMECARVFAERAAAGDRPLRTVVFAAWDAEEFGIIGSSEWVEANREALTAHGIAYINLDMASMGMDFNASGSPTLRKAIAQAAGDVAQAGVADKSVLDAWRARAPDPVAPWRGTVGDLGGGSDHVGFLCHAGLACCGLGGGGSKGWSYHSAYDTLPWYWKVVGTDYASAAMVTRVTTALVHRLAYARVLPLDAREVGADLHKHFVNISAAGVASGFLHAAGGGVAEELKGQDEAAATITQGTVQLWADLETLLTSEPPADEKRRALNAALIALDRAWMDEAGLPGRPWFQNLYAAPDEDSGYAAWMLPGLRKAVAEKDAGLLEREIARLNQCLGRFADAVSGVRAAIGSGGGPAGAR